MSKEINERYKRLENLGEGTYGVVSKAWDKKLSRYVAIKKIKMDVTSEGISCSSLREISALSDLKHENIVNLLEIYNNGRSLYLVFEFCDSDLQKFIKNYEGDIPLTTIKTILQQLIKALSYCHSHRTYHRDIKPGNVFMNNDGTIKLGDFGLSRVFRSESKHFTPEVISLWYRAPEILLKMPSYTSAVDMWSVGTIFGELILKRPLFCGQSEQEQIIQIFDLLGVPNERNWPGVNKYCHFTPDPDAPHPIDFNSHFSRIGKEGTSLLRSLLMYNPDDRMSAEKALEHPFFNC
ncbi:hypothetical protein ENUP19_0047G0129 [Entamoeba nuttalli]|uniref:Cyclin-dependent kinase 2 n=2 Tax=Entamoeba nuttalli TaxID=412467 RepID=K2HQL6_ENTNP|nr:cell division protein kinase 2, putative [Entamoeba nuttalli P19]EKE38200.1 cell division protein kinase 2, putative [Entamoeba nuttalli P19]|eukprot:XP_008859468.1 cell division protein kinase 2, putative [Entamoeba nuttalli P19]